MLAHIPLYNKSIVKMDWDALKVSKNFQYNKAVISTSLEPFPNAMSKQDRIYKTNDLTSISQQIFAL